MHGWGRPATIAAAIPLLLLVTGCSGDESTRTGAASSASSVPSGAGDSSGAAAPEKSGSAKQAPTKHPKMVATTPAQARSRPETAAVGVWAEAFGKVVNTGDADAARGTMTPGGLDRMDHYTGLDRGRWFPGPLPVTVTSVAAPKEDGMRLVQACIWKSGWSQASEMDPSTEHREIAPVVIGIVEHDSTWLVDGMADDPESTCAGVEIPTRHW